MTQVRKDAMRRTNNSEKMHDSICNEGAYSIVESQDFKNLKDSASAGCYTTPHIMHMRNAWRKDNNNLWRKATQTRDSAHRLQRELSQSSEDAHKAAQAVQMLEAQLTHIHKERTTVERLCGEINRSMETMQAALTVVKEQQLGGSSGSEIEMFLGTFGRRRVPKSPNPLVRNVLMLEDRIRSIQKQRVKDIRWRRIPHYSFLLMRDADLLELEKLRDAVEQNAEWQSAMREVEKSALHDMTLPQMHSLQGNKEKY